jgi:hypothetical protein
VVILAQKGVWRSCSRGTVRDVSGVAHGFLLARECACVAHSVCADMVRVGRELAMPNITTSMAVLSNSLCCTKITPSKFFAIAKH